MGVTSQKIVFVRKHQGNQGDKALNEETARDLHLICLICSTSGKRFILRSPSPDTKPMEVNRNSIFQVISRITLERACVAKQDGVAEDEGGKNRLDEVLEQRIRANQLRVARVLNNNKNKLHENNTGDGA